MKRLLLLLPLLALLMLTACENTSEPRFEGDVYTLSGVLYAGKPVSLAHPVYVTRSSEIEEFSPYDIFVGDAIVTLLDEDTGEVISLQPVLDEFKVKYTDPLFTPIVAEHTYRIDVQIPGYDKAIWAVTTVPPDVTLETDPYGTNPEGTGFSLDPESTNTTPFLAVDTQYPIVLNTGENSGNYNFFGEVYCLEDFSTDLEFTTPAFGIEHPTEDLREIYDAGGAFRRINFLYQFNSAQHPGIPGNSLILSDYSYAFVLYGRYRVSAFIVDDNTYRYTFMEEGYLHGGVHNALGYFGSASGGDMYINIVR